MPRVPIPRRSALGAVLLLALLAAPARGQLGSDSSAVRPGAFIQTVAAASGDASVEEGIALERVRLSVEGDPMPGLAYKVEADFADGFELKDARADIGLAPGVRLRVGQFKVPFSYSFLGSASATPFVRRPRVVGALRVGRRVGATLRYRTRGGALSLRGGLFDREAGTSADQDPAPLLYAGRVAVAIPLGRARVLAGANAAYEAGPDSLGVPTGWRYGGDVHAEMGRAYVTAEALALADALPGTVASGAYVTLGVAVAPPHRVRARLDHVATREGAEAPPPGTLLGAGYTFAPAGPLRFEVDVLVPVGDPAFDRGTLLASLEVDV